jgi:hypothetical protein
MKKAIFILMVLLFSCRQPTEIIERETIIIQPAEPINTPEPIQEPELIPEPIPEPEIIPEPPIPEPIVPPYGSTIIGDKAYHVFNGSAMSLDLNTGVETLISPAAREYTRNDSEFKDNDDTGRLVQWSGNAVFIESNGALWIIERNPNIVKAQVITVNGVREIGYQKQIDLLALSENKPGRKISMSFAVNGKFYYISLQQYYNYDSWEPGLPIPIPDYRLMIQNITLNPYADRPVVLGDDVCVLTVEKYTGSFIFELLNDGRVLAADKLFNLTEHGLRAE